jgi:endonuclease/exonuclease/phosphatase family metal-dependent hydrolase
MEQDLYSSGPDTKAARIKENPGAGVKGEERTRRERPHDCEWKNCSEEEIRVLDLNHSCVIRTEERNNKPARMKEVNGLKCMYTNMDTFVNKKAELLIRIEQLQPDIIGLTEVKPKHAEWALTDQDLVIQGYSLYSNLYGRGSALYVKEIVQSTELKLNCNFESSVWSTIALKNTDRLVVGVIYRSPSSKESHDQVIAMISEVIEMRHSHVLIMGDFNYPEINWDLQVSNSAPDHPSQRFIAGYKDWFLFQHVTQPTHYRAQQQANILDLVMTNECGMIDNIQYSEPVGRSHHCLLNWTYKCYGTQSKIRVKKYLFDQGNYSDLRMYLGNKDCLNCLSGKNVNDMWLAIHETILAAMEEFVPHKYYIAGQFRKRKPLWMNDRALDRIKMKKEAFIRYKETKDGKDFLEYVKSRNAAKTAVRKAVRDYEKEILSRQRKILSHSIDL